MVPLASWEPGDEPVEPGAVEVGVAGLATAEAGLLCHVKLV